MSAESPGGPGSPVTGVAPDWPPDCAGDWVPDCAPSCTEPGTTAASDPRTSDRRRAVRIMLPPAMRTTDYTFPAQEVWFRSLATVPSPAARTHTAHCRSAAPASQE